MKKRQIIFLMILLFSCSNKLSKDNISRQFVNRSIQKVIPTIHLLKSDSLYSINFTFACPCNDNDKIEFLKSIDKITIDFRNTDDKSIKTFVIDNFQIAGIQNDFSNAKYILFFKINFKLQENIFNTLNQVKYTIETSKTKYSIYESIDKLFIKNEDDILDIYPVIRNRDKKSIEFGIFALRNKKADEYIPNSETLRIEILNNKRKPIWNSGYGGNFMQVINPVYPEKPGDSFIYSIVWLLKKNKGVKALSGKYKANLLIPALPKPYFTSFDFKLEDIKK